MIKCWNLGRLKTVTMYYVAYGVQRAVGRDFMDLKKCNYANIVLQELINEKLYKILGILNIPSIWEIGMCDLETRCISSTAAAGNMNSLSSIS